MKTGDLPTEKKRLPEEEQYIPPPNFSNCVHELPFAARKFVSWTNNNNSNT
jgi:hypothetical protein